MTVTVDDPVVGGTPDASQSFHLAITDLNEVLGGPGNDRLWGSVGNDYIDGGAGIHGTVWRPAQSVRDFLGLVRLNGRKRAGYRA